MRSLEASTRLLMVGMAVSTIAHGGLFAGLAWSPAGRWLLRADPWRPGDDPAAGAAWLARDDRAWAEAPWSEVEPPVPRIPPVQPPREPERLVRLGIPESEAQTETWLGYREPTPHAAPLSRVEQSGMSLDPGSGELSRGREAFRLSGPGMPATDSRAAAQSADAPPGHEAIHAAGTQGPPAQNASPAPRSDPAGTDGQTAPSEPAGAGASLEIGGSAIRPDVSASAEPADAGTPSGPHTEAMAHMQALSPAEVSSGMEHPIGRGLRNTSESLDHLAHGDTASGAGAILTGGSQPGAGRGESMAGLPADREALAAAIRAAPAVRPGQVVAGQGLEILTRQPRWSTTTVLTHRPRNPVVEIVFDREGRVRRAQFVRDGQRVYNTGYEDVDQPLLSAIYAWQARGRVLAELPPDDPDAGAKVILTILLR